MTMDPFLEQLVSAVRSKADPTAAVERLLRERDESRDVGYLREISRLKDKLRSVRRDGK